MARRSRVPILAAALIGGGALALLVGEPAHAIVGRPLTPISYAGVARRTTRRAVAYGTAATMVHPVVAPPVVAAPVVAAPVVAAPTVVRPVVVW